MKVRKPAKARADIKMLRPAVMRRPISVTVDPSVYNDLRRRAIAADISLSHLCEVILSKAARKD